MKYTFYDLDVDQYFLQPTEYRTSCILEPENIADFSTLTKLMVGCRVHADSNAELPSIKNVYFNPPATIVLWDDGTKTVVKCQDGDAYSKEVGLALCMVKKVMGNSSRKLNDIFKKWIPEEKPENKTPPHKGIYKSCHNCKHDMVCCNCDGNYSNWERRK